MSKKHNLSRWLLAAILMLVLGLAACSTTEEPVPVEEPAAEPVVEEPAAEEPAAAEPTTAEPTVIKIGVAHALSGPIALYGEPISQGIALAVKEVNEQAYLGEGVTLEVVLEDTAGDKEQAIAVFEKLINQDQVVAILGPTLSNSAFAADPVAQEAGVPVIGSSNTATGITDMGDFVFRTSLPESAVIPNTLAVVAEARGMTKVAVMYGNDDQFTQSGYEVFAAALEEMGIEVVTTETFAKGDTDFSAQLTKIKSLEPQAIVTSALAEEAANIMTQARQLGIGEEIYFIGGNGFNSPKLAEIAGPAAEGAISGAAWFISNPTPANEAFVEAYRAEYGGDPDQFAAQAYTAAWVLAEAIKNATAVEPAAIRDALNEVANFDTPLGSFGFTENRDPDHTPVVLTVQDGVFALFTE
jgi:branched-chain amino acid transport system substrate-binding protein